MDSEETEDDVRYLKESCVKFNMMNTMILKLQAENQRLQSLEKKKDEEIKSLQALIQKLPRVGANSGTSQDTMTESCSFCSKCQRSLSNDEPMAAETSSTLLQAEQATTEEVTNSMLSGGENSIKDVRRYRRKKSRRETKSDSTGIAAIGSPRKTRSQIREEEKGKVLYEVLRKTREPATPPVAPNIEQPSTTNVQSSTIADSTSSAPPSNADSSHHTTATSPPLQPCIIRLAKADDLKLKVIPVAADAGDKEEESFTLSALKQQIGLSNGNDSDDPDVNPFNKVVSDELFGSGLDNDDDDCEIGHGTSVEVDLDFPQSEPSGVDVEDTEKIVKITGTQKESCDEVVLRKESVDRTKAVADKTVDRSESKPRRNRSKRISRESIECLTEENVKSPEKTVQMADLEWRMSDTKISRAQKSGGVSPKKIVRIADIQKERIDVVHSKNIVGTRDVPKESSAGIQAPEKMSGATVTQSESSAGIQAREKMPGATVTQSESSANIQAPEKMSGATVTQKEISAGIQAREKMRGATVTQSESSAGIQAPEKIRGATVTQSESSAGIQPREKMRGATVTQSESSAGIQTSGITSVDRNESSGRKRPKKVSFSKSVKNPSDKNKKRSESSPVCSNVEPLTDIKAENLTSSPQGQSFLPSLFTSPKPPPGTQKLGLFSPTAGTQSQRTPPFLQGMRSPRSSDGYESMKSPRRSIEAVIERLSTRTRVQSDASCGKETSSASVNDTITRYKPTPIPAHSLAPPSAIVDREATPKENSSNVVDLKSNFGIGDAPEESPTSVVSSPSNVGIGDAPEESSTSVVNSQSNVETGDAPEESSTSVLNSQSNVEIEDASKESSTNVVSSPSNVEIGDAPEESSTNFVNSQSNVGIGDAQEESSTNVVSSPSNVGIGDASEESSTSVVNSQSNVEIGDAPKESSTCVVNSQSDVTEPPVAAVPSNANEGGFMSPFSSPSHQGVTIEDIFREMSSTTTPDELLADMENPEPVINEPAASELIEDEQLEKIFDEMHLPAILSPIHDMTFDSNPLTPIDTNSQDANDETCPSPANLSTSTTTTATPPTPNNLRKVVEAAALINSSDSSSSGVSRKKLPIISLISSPVKVSKSAVISRAVSVPKRRLSAVGVDDAGVPVRKKSRTLVTAAKKTPRSANQATSGSSSSESPSLTTTIQERVGSSAAVTAAAVRNRLAASLPKTSRQTKASPMMVSSNLKRKRCMSIADVTRNVVPRRKVVQNIQPILLQPELEAAGMGEGGLAALRLATTPVANRQALMQGEERSTNVSDVPTNTGTGVPPPRQTRMLQSYKLVESPRQLAINARLMATNDIPNPKKHCLYTVIKTEDSQSVWEASTNEITSLLTDEVTYHRLTQSNIAVWFKTLLTYTFHHDTLKNIATDHKPDHSAFDSLMYTMHPRELEMFGIFTKVDKSHNGEFLRRTIGPVLLKFLCRYCIALGRKTYVTEDVKVYNTFSELFTAGTDVLPHEYCCSLARMYCVAASSNNDFRSIIDLMRLIFINCGSAEAMSMAFEVLMTGMNAFLHNKLTMDMVIIGLYFRSSNIPEKYQKGDSIPARDFRPHTNSQLHLHERATKANGLLRQRKLEITTENELELQCDRLLSSIIGHLFDAQLIEMSEKRGIYELIFSGQVDTYTSLELLALTRGTVYSTMHIVIGKLEPILHKWMVQTVISTKKIQVDGDDGDQQQSISDETFIATLRAISTVATALAAKINREDPNRKDNILHGITERICGLCTSSYADDEDDEEKDGLPVYSDVIESAIIGTVISFGLVNAKMVRECLAEYLTYSARLKIKPHPLVEQISALTTPIQIKETLKFMDRSTSDIKLYPYFYSS